MTDDKAAEEVAELRALTRRLSALLTGVANALKGQPDELHLHDWSDLPAVAAQVKAERDQVAGDMPAGLLNAGEIARVLTLFHSDNTENLWWTADRAGHLHFQVLCNDAFAWACADGEEITPDTLPELERAQQDAVTWTDDPTQDDFGLLFVSRLRGMRPQGAMYRYLDRRLWPLFDAAGPERELGLGNPHARPADEETP